MVKEYKYGSSEAGKLVVTDTGRIIARESIYLMTYGSLELSEEVYLSGPENVQTKLAYLEGKQGVGSKGWINAKNLVVIDSGDEVTHDYSDLVLNMVNGALTFEGEDLILNIDGDIDLKDIRVTGRIELTATGTITVSSVIAGSGEVHLESTSADIVIQSLDASNSQSRVNLKAAETIQVGSAAALKAGVGGLKADAQTVHIDGMITATTDIELRAEGELTVDGTLIAGQDIQLTSHYLPVISSGLSLSINGILMAGQHLSINSSSAGSVTIMGILESGSHLTIISGGILELTASGSLMSASASVSLITDQGDIKLLGAISSAEDLNLISAAAVNIAGTLIAKTAVSVVSTTSTCITHLGRIEATDQIILEAAGAISIEGTLIAQSFIGLYSSAELTLAATSRLSGFDNSDTDLVYYSALTGITEAEGSTVQATIRMRIFESIANLTWSPTDSSTTWMNVKDNENQSADLVSLFVDNTKVLLLSNVALFGETDAGSYELAASGQDAAATTPVYFYVLTVDVVTDQSTDEQTIHFTAENITNRTIEHLIPVNDYANIDSVSGSDLVDGLIGLDMSLIEIDAITDADYQQAFYSLLTLGTVAS